MDERWCGCAKAHGYVGALLTLTSKGAVTEVVAVDGLIKAGV